MANKSFVPVQKKAYMYNKGVPEEICIYVTPEVALKLGEYSFITPISIPPTMPCATSQSSYNNASNYLPTSITLEECESVQPTTSKNVVNDRADSSTNEQRNCKNSKNKTGAKPEKKQVIRSKRDRPFKCTQCSHSFTRNAGLQDHITREHTDKFTCNICSRTFPSENALQAHHEQFKLVEGCWDVIQQKPKRYRHHPGGGRKPYKHHNQFMHPNKPTSENGKEKSNKLTVARGGNITEKESAFVVASNADDLQTISLSDLTNSKNLTSNSIDISETDDSMSSNSNGSYCSGDERS